MGLYYTKIIIFPLSLLLNIINFNPIVSEYNLTSSNVHRDFKRSIK